MEAKNVADDTAVLFTDSVQQLKDNLTLKKTSASDSKCTHYVTVWQ